MREDKHMDKLPNDNHTPAALYARVSSERQDVDLSVSAQLRALRDYAQKNGYVVAREYVDEAESGRIADRPQFRKMLDEATRPDAPFHEILVWKFSRFTRKREHAVAFKSMLKKKGVRVVSITEHADDTPTGKLMEAIIESVDEFYSENLAQEVNAGHARVGLKRGFWVATLRPLRLCRRVIRPRRPQEAPPVGARPARRLRGPAHVRHGAPWQHDARHRQDPQRGGHTQSLRAALAEGVHLPHAGQRGLHRRPRLGKSAKDNAPPVRVEDAFPAIVTKEEFQRVTRLLGSRAPRSVHPRRVASPYLLSGLLTCERCGRALSASEAMSGKYTYYVCHSLLNRGKGTCQTPRLNAKRFEQLILDQIREHILTESNVRDLVRSVNEEMDSVIKGERERVEAAELELAEVRRRMDRLWRLVESTEMTVEDILPRIRHHQENQERLERAADEARRLLSMRMASVQDEERVAAYAAEMSEFLLESGLAETKAFVRSFVKQVVVRPGKATIHYTMLTPEDNPIGGADIAEVALARSVMKSVTPGEPVEP